MTPTEIEVVSGTVRALWPRVKWGAGEWSVLEENAAHIRIDSEQVLAAIRNVKATSDKYPTVAAILAALRRAENRPAIGQASPLPPTLTRIGEMRKRMVAQGHLDFATKPASEVVVGYWHDACHRSMRARGDIPGGYEADYLSDAMEAAKMSRVEADDWWAWMLDDVKDVPIDPKFAAAFARCRRQVAAIVTGGNT